MSMGSAVAMQVRGPKSAARRARALSADRLKGPIVICHNLLNVL